MILDETYDYDKVYMIFEDATKNSAFDFLTYYVASVFPKSEF